MLCRAEPVHRLDSAIQAIAEVLPEAMDRPAVDFGQLRPGLSLPILYQQVRYAWLKRASERPKKRKQSINNHF